MSTTPHLQKHYPLNEQVDFVIVGCGASGGVLARELSQNGFSVVVLEQGPWKSAKDFGHNEFLNWSNSELTNDFRKQPQTFRRTPQDKAQKQPSIMYGQLVGGGTVHFTANYWRFHEIDFIEASKKGTIAGTGFADWPITYADLEPYYTKAEWDLGVSGEAGASPFDPPRSKPYPLPPMPVKPDGILFERGARKLGYHPYPAPVAVISKAYQGRMACQHCGWCEGFGCEHGAKSSPLPSMIPQAMATGRCEIRPHSYVRKVDVDANGRATGVVYFDEHKVEKHQHAKAVILAANGAETPRLLLISKSNRFPDGLANSSGLVGKYLMFNTDPMSAGLFEHELNGYKSIEVTRTLMDFYEVDPKLGFYGGGGITARFQNYPISFAFGGLPPDIPQWGIEYKKALAKYFVRSMCLMGHTTSLPVEDNSISLDDTVKDDWGLPAMRVTYKDHPDDLKFAKWLQDRSMEILEAAGAQNSWRYPITESNFAVHLLGTCRMGDDAKSSVINADHRTHDVPNLFLCDGSSFVTSGRGQPTETIQALAFRAGDRITALAKKNEI
jgi:choline dehydrogenase-like flavoprotein